MPDNKNRIKKLLRQNWSVLVLSGVIVLAELFAEQLGPALQYQRQAVFEGQIYRLLTAHLVHTGINHTLLNLAGLILIWLLSHRNMTQAEWWLVMLVSALFVSGGLVLFSQEVQWYRGLSGVLHGALVVAILRARQLAWTIRGAALFVLGIKIILEQTHSGLWQSEQLIGAPVIVAAHLYGVMGGIAGYFVLRSYKPKRMFSG